VDTVPVEAPLAPEKEVSVKDVIDPAAEEFIAVFGIS
tara:strand:+ start:181 stop:291 length:111 start_codon:yes stop_codon:yes gene_type:complete